MSNRLNCDTPGLFYDELGVGLVYLSLGVIASYALTAVVFASLGFVVNGVLSATKVSGLYSRLDHVETLYQRQMVVLTEMAALIQQMSRQAAGDAAHMPGAEALARLEQLMAHSMASGLPGMEALSPNPRFR
ncbi:hypothetical protein [Novosphingobium terrae]|uniref:hypothetical protein n=1 Tax=Novosphingobium terrae TaxID=2726189 RepID=UPI00197EA940|nr:hypothetical protein [Novosphingobium terrae]